MEKITVNAEFLFELESKEDWVNKVPNILPPKTRGGEQWIWVEKLWDKMTSKDYKSRLIIAGALIAAEIDRLQNEIDPNDDLVK